MTNSDPPVTAEQESYLRSVHEMWHRSLEMEDTPRRCLSPRRLDVLRLVAEGYTAGEIGERLGLTEKTVENHRAAIVEHFEARNMVHAVVLALQGGEITLDGIGNTAEGSA